MATAAVQKLTIKTNRKDLAQEVMAKLEKALADFKDVLGEKKFRNRLKKASKLFLKGKEVIEIRKTSSAVKKESAPAKKRPVTTRTAKKAAAKK